MHDETRWTWRLDRTFARGVTSLALLLTLAACGGGGGGAGGGGADLEVGPDAGAGPDAGTDAGASPDAGADPEGGADAGSGLDAGPGLDGGAEPDGGSGLERPPVPTGLQASAGQSQATLSWNASPGATAYTLARDVGCTGAFSDLPSLPETRYTDSGLTAGTPYCYAVRAGNAAGTSAPSAEASAVPLAARRLCVGNTYDRTVTVYDLTASGNTPPVRRLGNLTDVQIVKALAYDPVHEELFVLNTRPPGPSVTVYARTAQGNVAPVRSFWLLHFGTPVYPAGLAVDTLHDTLVLVHETSLHTVPRSAQGRVTGSTFSPPMSFGSPVALAPDKGELFVSPSAGTIAAYPLAGDSTTPLRTLSGANTGLGSQLTSLSYDPVRDELIITNPTRLLVFPRTAAGNTYPTQEITTSVQGITGVKGVAVYGPNGDFHVSTTQGVVVYTRASGESEAPVRRLSGAATGFASPNALVMDSARGELFVSDLTPSRVAVHGRLASGNVAPLRALSGLEYGVEAVRGLAAVPGAGRLLVLNGESEFVATLSTFAMPWTGTPPPLSGLKGTATGLSLPSAAVVDEPRGELFVLEGSTVRVFSLGATGNTAPLRVLSGGLTGLSGPTSLALDPGRGELFVGNGNEKVLVFSRTASGNVSPLRTLSVSGLGKLSGLAVDPARGELMVQGAYSQGGGVRTYAVTTQDAGAPLRELSWRDAQPEGFSGFAWEPSRDELYVTHATAQSVLVLPRMGTGGVTPLRTLVGSDTRLARPTGVALCE